MRTASKAVLTEMQSARLERILEATKRLLGELGAERMTMRDVAAASEVAEGTLYNRFGGKDDLITVAVVDYFERSVQSIVEHRHSKSPVQKFVYGMSVVTKAILQAKPFARALMRTYFRVDNRLEMTDRLTQSVYSTWLPVIQEMQAQQLLRDWVSPPLLCSEICERLFGVVLKWAQGGFPDKELHDRCTLSVLLQVLAASRGSQVKEIETIMIRLSKRLKFPRS